MIKKLSKKKESEFSEKITRKVLTFSRGILILMIKKKS